MITGIIAHMKEYPAVSKMNDLRSPGFPSNSARIFFALSEICGVIGATTSSDSSSGLIDSDSSSGLIVAVMCVLLRISYDKLFKSKKKILFLTEKLKTESEPAGDNL